MPLVNAGAAVASAAAGAATSAAGAAAGKAAGAASAAAGAAVGAASVVSSAAGVAATAALSAKERAAQVAPAPSDAAGLALEVGHAAGDKVVAAGQMVKGAAGEVKSMTSGIAEQAVSHASGAVEGVMEQAAKQKQRMEKLADHFKDLLEGFMKRKLHRVLKMLVGRLPSLLKSATDDVEMPTRVKRAKDAAIDVIWPDIEQEIMWDLALRIDGAAGNEYPEDYRGCTCCLSFFRYHIYPYDRGFWGNLRDPIWLLFTLVALLPVHGVSPAVFLVIFLLIDKTDEFQLVSFILQFKGFQFLTQGVLRSLVGFFMYLHCVTAVADAEHECANAGPGSSAPMAIALAGYVLQVVLVWIAFLLLPCSSRRRGTLQGHLDHAESGSSTSRGGYILNLLWYDLFTFAICAGTFVYVLSLRDWDLQDWPTKHAFFAVQMVNGFLSFPFFFFMVPFLRNILLHSVPTAYDRFGRCRQYQGPPRPVKEVKEGKSIPTQLLEKAEALRILESFKTLLSGGKVDSLDAEEEPAPATVGKANVE